MNKLFNIVGGAIVLSIFVAGFIAYFVASFNVETHTWYDGWGRELSESPWLARLIFGQERLWPGWAWFFADIVILWGGLMAGVGIAGIGDKLEKK